MGSLRSTRRSYRVHGLRATGYHCRKRRSLEARMKPGTRSLLWGEHQFLLHPLFVALAWWRLFGFPLDPRLWFCFFVHDIGYLGKPNMDGTEGKTQDRKSTRLNSSHVRNSYAVFCLKKKKKKRGARWGKKKKSKEKRKEKKKKK